MCVTNRCVSTSGDQCAIEIVDRKERVKMVPMVIQDKPTSVATKAMHQSPYLYHTWYKLTLRT